MEPTNWTDRPTDGALYEIKRHPTYYAGLAQHHALGRGEGRGALFATWSPNGGILTFYLSAGDSRSFLREEGGAWLQWFKQKVRPVLRTYDPEREAVVLTRHEDGPRVTVIEVQTEKA